MNMMKKWIYISLAAVLLTTCQKPKIELVDFDTFHVTEVKNSDVIVNGKLNPEIRTMEDGTQYTLVICGCEEGELTSVSTIVKFIYHPGNIQVLSIEEGDEW